MISQYVPAVHYSAVLTEGANPHGIPLHWCNPEWPDRFYPHVLWSFAYWKDQDPSKWIPDFEKLDVLGDSGGYAVITQGENFDPQAIRRWQLRWCNRGMILDIPPYRPAGSVQFTGTASEYFEESLVRTFRNVSLGLVSHDNDNRSKWWGVVQGESMEQMQRWHDKLSEIYKFKGMGEGWALAPKPSTDLIACTRYIKFAHLNSIRRIHVLQITKPRTVATVLALAQMAGTFDFVSYDSATQTRAAINRTIFWDDNTWVLRHSRGTTLELEVALQGCVCPGCMSYAAITKDYGKPDDTQFWRYLMLHNQVTLKHMFARIHKDVEADPEYVLRSATGRDYGAVMREWEGAVAVPSSKHSVSIFDRLR